MESLRFDEVLSRRFEGVATPVLKAWNFSNLIASTPEDDKRGVDFFGTDFKGRPCIVFCRARYREGGSVDPTFNWDQSVEKVLKLREENPERILYYLLQTLDGEFHLDETKVIETRLIDLTKMFGERDFDKKRIIGSMKPAKNKWDEKFLIVEGSWWKRSHLYTHKA